ncbi:amino acid transporter [Pseudomonas protegens]|uniref:Amino acid transporter n=1 Tax=Pseudomonas protegens TaxID=380021 RepID=A0A9Q6ICA8_9PSED|nr:MULTISPECIES: amino acid permease [Pseudomonas]MDP9517633.1 amino acid permease [Pseudomonas protegens]NMY71729.1 amino acid permease [Pseudomonas sp. WS 5414]PYB98697.1 amino acid transporter [Pseudomonas protegens]PYC31017.1 amino acid transporter [Pseudomonas protegens]ROL90547.1 amino acid transporter [Pseudomonas protegens]
MIPDTFGACEHPTLQRTLHNRHIQLMAMGGAIGTGLFMGSGKIIAMSGTSIILIYMIIGLFVYLVMRAMGELLLSNLNFKSFADFAGAYLGPQAAFFLGWSYWLSWSVAVVGDAVVVGGFFQYWFPDVPAWVPAIAMMLTLFALNVLTVKLFGEVEFWFAIIKIIAVVTLIAVSLVLIATAFVSPSGVSASLNHLLDRQAAFPNGLLGFFAGFQMAIFSFAGTELIGTAAAETRDPRRTLPKAINAIPLRIILFYVLALACIIAVTSWQQVSPSKSPFVELFLIAGFPAAAGIVNFVVLTSAASSANSGVFSASRMLFGLADQGNAPRVFKRLSGHSVPVISLAFTSLLMLLGVLLLYVVPEVMTAFTLVSTVSAILVIFTWSTILASYIAYRKKHPELHAGSQYKMPGGVPMAWFALAFLLFVLALLALRPDTRLALCVMPAWFVWLAIAYRLTAGRKGRTPVQAAAQYR